MDEAFGIGTDELKDADAVLSKNVYFWIAYQHVDDAPIEETLAGKPRPCLILEKLPVLLMILTLLGGIGISLS